MSNRVVLGERLGDIGLWVSKPGVNAAGNQNPENFIYYMGESVGSAHAQGVLTLNPGQADFQAFPLVTGGTPKTVLHPKRLDLNKYVSLFELVVLSVGVSVWPTGISMGVPSFSPTAIELHWWVFKI